MFNAAQLRAARGLLDVSQKELASSSGVSLATIKRLEIDGGPEAANYPTIRALESFFADKGVSFVESGVAFGEAHLEGAAKLLRARAAATSATTATKKSDESER
jgi:transcriptional regulator with XRE-family HTH domain